MNLKVEITIDSGFDRAIYGAAWYHPVNSFWQIMYCVLSSKSWNITIFD